MFKSSITKFLITSLGILMTGLFVAALILAVEAWTNYALAGRIARLICTYKPLVYTLVTVRAEVPKNSTALLTEENHRSMIGTTYAVASRTVATALVLLESTAVEDHPQ